MADLWYYSHDQLRIGPCSARRMRELAAGGTILPSDTVWKEGVERGVAASKVKNLFGPAPAADAPAPQPPAPSPAPDPAPPVVAAGVAEGPARPGPECPPEQKPAPAATGPVPAEGAPVAAPAPTWRSQEPRKGRATAGRGAVVVAQDGVTVKYRKKCTTCGHADSAWHNMPIRNGVMRSGYYCPRCRKHRDVEVHGSLN